MVRIYPPFRGEGGQDGEETRGLGDKTESYFWKVLGDCFSRFAGSQ